MTNYELLCELQHEAVDLVVCTYREWEDYELYGEVNAKRKQAFMAYISKYTDRAYQLGKIIDSMPVDLA